MSTCPVFCRTPMSTQAFSNSSVTSSCVSTKIALFWSLAARVLTSSPAAARGMENEARRVSRGRMFFICERLYRWPDSHLSLGRGFPLLEGARGDHLANRLHPVQVEEDVVNREEHRRRKILQDEEIPQVSPAVAAADRAAALGIERREVLLESLVLDRDLAPPRVDMPHAAVPRGKNAVEEVAARAHRFQKVGRSAHAHQVPRLLIRQEPRRELGDGADRLLRFPHRDPADRVSGKVQIDERR